MEKIKNIITGILSVAVFFMAIQVGVAQEKINNEDKVEFKESVDAGNLTLSSIKSSDAYIQHKAIGIKKVLTATYFEFIGDPGEEDDITKWRATTDDTGCGGLDWACKIKIKPEYLMDDNGVTVIDPSELSQIDVLPGSSGLYNVPDPAQVGGGSNQPFEEIHNQPEP